nr:MAG TPA: hypothetical protein [Caudoviricetes sp.]
MLCVEVMWTCQSRIAQKRIYDSTFHPKHRSVFY